MTTDLIPELPPVSPEDLVEGEWYVVNLHQFDGSPVQDVCYFTGIELLKTGSDYEWLPKDVLAIYGPLRFKIGGAE